MAFVYSDAESKVYAPGYFLADAEDCLRITFEADAENDAVVTDGNGKYLPMGTIYRSNDENAVGIVYEDVDVTNGNMPGSLVVSGIVYEDKLPDDVDPDAKTALTGIQFISDTTVTRP